MMEITADDNFFIEEPQKLRSNFFTKDKSIQMVEMLATPKQRIAELGVRGDSRRRSNLNHVEDLESADNKIINNKLGRIAPNCRLTPYYESKLDQHQHQQLQTHLQKQLHQLQHQTPSPQQTTPTTMPRSIVARLELLCQASYNTDNLDMAQRAVDTLATACKSGCCFLERYIVMLVNFCTKNYAIADEPMKIKVEELLNKVLIVDFDRQQLIENFRKPEYKLNSIEQIMQLLQKVQDMQLDFRHQRAIEWLYVILDAYFVELAITDKAVEIIDQISAQTNIQCALAREIESTKSILDVVLEQMK